MRCSSTRNIPYGKAGVKGGQRCPNPATHSGMCWPHWKRKCNGNGRPVPSGWYEQDGMWYPQYKSRDTGYWPPPGGWSEFAIAERDADAEELSEARWSLLDAEAAVVS